MAGGFAIHHVMKISFLRHSYIILKVWYNTREQRNPVDTGYSELHTNLHRNVQC